MLPLIMLMLVMIIRSIFLESNIRQSWKPKKGELDYITVKRTRKPTKGNHLKEVVSISKPLQNIYNASDF